MRLRVRYLDGESEVQEVAAERVEFGADQRWPAEKVRIHAGHGRYLTLSSLDLVEIEPLP